MEDNKKHKRALSNPQFIITDTSNDAIASVLKGKHLYGIFSSKRKKRQLYGKMAGTVSDDPSICRKANTTITNGHLASINATDSEREGDALSRESSLRLAHNRGLERNKSESHSHEPGMYIINPDQAFFVFGLRIRSFYGYCK